MGWFSSKKKVVVSSVIYNLLGEDSPVNLISRTIIDAHLKENPNITRAINDSIISGPGARMRSFIRWAKSSEYNSKVGVATSVFYDHSSFDNKEILKTKLASYLKVPESNLELIIGETNALNIFYFAEKWILENEPTYFPDNFTVKYIDTISGWEKHQREECDEGHGEESGECHTITWYTPLYTQDAEIVFPDGRKKKLDLRSIDLKGRFLYLQYKQDQKNNFIIYEYKKGILNFKNGIITIPGKPHSYPIDPDKKEEVIQGYTSEGINPSFEEVFSGVVPMYHTYAPYIPIRTWKKFISNEKGKEYLPDIYSLAKKATKRALGQNKYDDLIESVANNQKINDIDFTYLSFGAPLNIPFQEGRKYIYQFLFNFFKDIATSPQCINKLGYKDSSGLGSLIGKYEPKAVQIKSTKSSINYDIWLEWAGLQSNTNSGLCRPYAEVGKYYFWVDKDIKHYKLESYHEGGGEEAGETTITNTTKEEERTHLAFQESKDFYKELVLNNFCQANLIYGGKAVILSGEDALGCHATHEYKYYRYYEDMSGHDTGWQLTDEKHTENIPKEDTTYTEDLDLSGFIIPLQYNMLERVGLVASNQIMQCCNNIIFNCYKVYKVKWYQRGIFRIVMVVVAIVISVVIAWVSGGSGSSLSSVIINAATDTLGATLVAGGAALTLSTAICALVINAFATMILTTLIMKASTALFGDEIGLLIGTIASFIAGSVVNNMSLLTDTSTAISNIMANTPLLINSVGALTLSVVDGVTGIIQMKTAGIMEKMQTLQQETADKLEEINKKMKELMNTNSLWDLFLNSVIEPIKKIVYELPSMFLDRTKMTLLDIVQLNLNGIRDFTSLSTSIQLT